ncbi:MAG: hypothetical protein ACE5Q6_05235, partial [Dehalococcoidia bacterium]
SRLWNGNTFDSSNACFQAVPATFSCIDLFASTGSSLVPAPNRSEGNLSRDITETVGQAVVFVPVKMVCRSIIDHLGPDADWRWLVDR